jgi:hypothetical protein
MDANQIEQEIRRLLGEDTRAVPLSNKLFAPGGLFSRLASTREERELLVKSPLFKEAQKRISELEKRDIAEFERLVKDYTASAKSDDLLIRVEEAPRT